MLASVYRISWTLLITFRDTLLADARPLKPTSFFKTGSYGIFRSSAKRLDSYRKKSVPQRRTYPDLK